MAMRPLSCGQKLLGIIFALSIVPFLSAEAGESATYLSANELSAIGIVNLLPPSPPVGSETDQIDVAEFWGKRSLVLTPRGLEAANDDVYAASDVWSRFSPALTTAIANDSEKLTPLFNLMTKAIHDAESLVAPIKKNLPLGRERPFVRFAGTPTCLEPIDLVPGHRDSDYSYNLKGSGSYPSTHAMIGILWAEVLAEIYPDKEPQLLERGIRFGESRAVCGFHFESDISAGRMAAHVLFAKLQTNKAFRTDLHNAKLSLLKK